LEESIAMTDTSEIINAILVVGTYNRPHQTLASRWMELTPDATNWKAGAEDALRDGSTVFEYLSKANPQLADVIHDFVYQISNAGLSVVAKNLAREEVAKTVLQIV
jgi:hypothetical protein